MPPSTDGGEREEVLSLTEPKLPGSEFEELEVLDLLLCAPWTCTNGGLLLSRTLRPKGDLG